MINCETGFAIGRKKTKVPHTSLPECSLADKMPVPSQTRQAAQLLTPLNGRTRPVGGERLGTYIYESRTEQVFILRQVSVCFSGETGSYTLR